MDLPEVVLTLSLCVNNPMVSDTAGCEIIYKEEYPKVVDCFNIGHKLAVDIEKTQAENKWISIKCTRLRGKKE